MEAATWAAIFAGVGPFVTAGAAFVAYKAARQGPRKTPEWRLRLLSDSAAELSATKGNPVAHDVTLVFPVDDPEQSPRVDGTTSWSTFSPGQRAVFYPQWAWGVSPWNRRARVQWRSTHRGDPCVWESNMPATVD